MTERDWYAWHAPYDDPGSGLSRRLRWVQDRIRAALDDAPAGPFSAISICAGQGRDVIDVLAGHPRGGDVTARLVELDPRNVAVARQRAAEAGLANVEIVAGDAALTSAYAGIAPADLVLACGLFGNMTDAHVKRVIGYCTQLCAAGGTVIWTRARWEPDLVPRILDWFSERDFELLWISEPQPDWRQCCGAHRFAGTPAPLEEGATMFAFTDHDVQRGPSRTT